MKRNLPVKPNLKMKRNLMWSIVAVCCLAVILLLVFRPWESQPNTAGNNYLTVADVEKVTGINGLRVTETATGGLIFETGFLGTRIIEVLFGSPGLWKNEVIKNWSLYEPIPGIGDKAAVREPHTAFRLIFAKGSHVVMVEAVPKDGKVPLSRDQLIKISKIIDSRL